MAVRGQRRRRPAAVRAKSTTAAAATPVKSATQFIPARPTLRTMREAVQECRGCDLYKNATQAVFGEGRTTAEIVMVGEQPGDAEDRAGRPFVGPSGRLLDRALEAAGIDRDDVYVTNAVKHFKWAREARSKRRIHKTPSRLEVRACLPWLEAEIALVEPRVIVCLGATAAKALLGPSFSVLRHRGAVLDSPWGDVIATVHPSAVLRAPPERRADAERAFMADMRAVARRLDRAR